MAAGRVLSAHWTSRTFSEWPSALEWKSKEVGVNHLFSHVCVCCQHACLFCGIAAFGFTKPMCVCVSTLFSGGHNRGGSGAKERLARAIRDRCCNCQLMDGPWRRSLRTEMTWKRREGPVPRLDNQPSAISRRWEIGTLVMGRRRCRIWSTLKLDTPSPYCVWKTHYLCSLLCRQQLSRSRLQWLKESVSYPRNLKRCFRHLRHA